MNKIVKISIISAITILIGALIGIAAYMYYFAPNNSIVQAFDEGKLNLVIEDKLINDGNPIIHNQEIMLPFDIIKKYIDPNIYWDDKLKIVTVTTKDRVIRMKTDKLDAFINNKPINLKIPVIEENKAVYVPIEFLSDFYSIEINFLKDKNVIIIDNKSSSKKIAEPVSAKAVIRKGDTIKYPIFKKYDINNLNDSKMVVFDDNGNWCKVRSQEGIVGYIEKKYIKITNQIADNTPTKTEKSAWKPSNGKINLVWDAIYTNDTMGWKKDSKIDGLDVVSPTWFEVKDKKGTVSNRASKGYVDWAHRNNYKVWAHLSNNVGGSDSTGAFLNNTDARDNAIKQVLAYCVLYKLDGINIDFEDMNEGDKDAFTQFVRELTPLLKEQGLNSSVDVTIPGGSGNWSLCYDRKALADCVDYVMLMAYDQYWSTSPVSGSVAQFTWVEDSINKVLQYVPKEKFLLGLPYYTRVWKEEKGKTPKSSSISMARAKKLISENNASVTWDQESGQFYAEYKKDGVTNRIWLEDEKSINLKSSLIQKYNLAGAAGWRKDFEVPEIWEVLNKNLKVFGNYNEWINQNKEIKYVFKN